MRKVFTNEVVFFFQLSLTSVHFIQRLKIKFNLNAKQSPQNDDHKLMKDQFSDDMTH